MQAKVKEHRVNKTDRLNTSNHSSKEPTLRSKPENKYVFLGQKCFKDQYENIRKHHNRIQSAKNLIPPLSKPPSQQNRQINTSHHKVVLVDLEKENHAEKEKILAIKCIGNAKRSSSQTKKEEAVKAAVRNYSTRELLPNSCTNSNNATVLDQELVSAKHVEPVRRFKAPLPPRRKQSPLSQQRSEVRNGPNHILSNISSSTNVNTSANVGSSTPHSVASQGQNISFNSVKRNQSSHMQRLNSFQALPNPPIVTSRCWSIYDQQKFQFVGGKRENIRREVASLTKIMTFYTVLQLLEEYKIDCDQEKVKVSEIASQVNGTSANLKQGDLITVRDLFYGLMLPSGNDAAWALAEHFGSLIEKKKFQKQGENYLSRERIHSYKFNWSVVRFFLNEMNKNAIKLQMFSTNYDSPHGLMNKWNYSSAHDVAKLASRCMKIERFREVVSTREYQCQATTKSGGKRHYKWDNTNKLLGKEHYNGVKTGVTDIAGPCLAVSYEESENKNFIVVILNCKSMDQRWAEVPQLVSWACSKKQMQLEANEGKENLNKNKGLIKRVASLR